MNLIRRLIQIGCAVLLLIEAACLMDLFSFEWAALWGLAGWGGAFVLLLLNATLLLGACGLFFSRPGARRWLQRSAVAVLIATLLLVVFIADWMFRAQPVSIGWGRADAFAATPDFDAFSIVRNATPEHKQALQVVYDRVRLNSPDVYTRHPIGTAIDKYATRYEVDPLLLFYLAFMNSFYGEAEAGPIPLFQAMTPETVRDVVQIHLPSWFIESALRQKFIATAVPGVPAEGNVTFKLHYAFHKATLDVSSQPYDINTFTDVMLVMQEYPDEFADILREENHAPLDVALREAFVELRGAALQKPYEMPAGISQLGDRYYDEHRSSLKRFARASYYKTALDFDFATRVMALVIKYQRAYYRHRLGEEAWSKLPSWQQSAMTAMTRDLFTPGVGKLGYNLYAIPEINCAPVEYVASQARLSPDIMSGALGSIWRPANPEYLWAGAAFRLRVFHELWYAAYGLEIPGLHRDEAISQARQLLDWHRN